MKVRNNTGKSVCLINKTVIGPYAVKEIRDVSAELMSQLKQLEKNKVVKLS